MIATRITRNLLAPVVNLNGSDGNELALAYHRVAMALSEANAAMGKAMPHGRDYQTLNPKDFGGQDPAILARAAFNERRQVLLEMEREFEEMALFINQQGGR